MRLARWSVTRPLWTCVGVLLVVCSGLLALRMLRVNLYPDVEPPVLIVRVALPGAAPDAVERDVINRLERPLMAVGGVTSLSSTATDGVASFSMRFAFGTSLAEATEKIRAICSAERSHMPSETEEPIIERRGTAHDPVVTVALSSSTGDINRASVFAEDVVSDELRAIPGVQAVVVRGARKRELAVELHADRLRSRGVSIDQVLESLKRYNASDRGGTIERMSGEVPVEYDSQLLSASDFESIPLLGGGGASRAEPSIHLGDVATITSGFAPVQEGTEHDGHPDVSIEVYRGDDASTLTVSADVRARLQALRARLPADLRLDLTFDAGADARKSLDNVTEALLFGAVLTIAIVFTFLGSWRSTVITALSLPVSVLGGFVGVWLFGFTLNFMTLLSLSLAIGVLIDDAIVVRENIVRHQRRGLSPFDAALTGTSEIGGAVTGTTLAIVSVFLPVAFVPGIAGQWFKPFGLTVCAAVLVSLVVSFTVDPMLSALWKIPTSDLAPSAGRSIQRHWIRFTRLMDGLVEGLTEVYGRLMTGILEHRVLVLAATVSILFAAICAQVLLGGTSFLPEGDSGYLMIDVKVPAGSGIVYSKEKVEEAARAAWASGPVLDTDTAYNAGGGTVSVWIGPRSQRSEGAEQYAAALRRRLQRLIGAEFVVLQDSSGGAGKPVQLRLHGQDAQRLTALASDLAGRLRRVPGAVDVGLTGQDPRPELNIRVDRGAAESRGVAPVDVARALRVAFAGMTAGDWIDQDGRAREVVVRMAATDRSRSSDIERLQVPVGGGSRLVPLSAVSRMSVTQTPARIEHVDGQRMVTVSANVEGRSPGEITATAVALARSLEFPPGYGVSLEGASRQQADTFGALGMAAVLGVLAMLLILVLQFECIAAPLVVVASLPFALIGVIASLFITRSTFNLMSLIGVIMLMGIVAKNAILLIDATRVLEKQGVSRRQALVAAGRQRLRPILMTTLALVAGMTPVALASREGSDLYRPMATAIIGGTLSSMFFTLVVVPALYDAFDGVSEAIRHWRAPRRVVSRVSTFVDSILVEPAADAD